VDVGERRNRYGGSQSSRPLVATSVPAANGHRDPRDWLSYRNAFERGWGVEMYVSVGNRLGYGLGN
jgi:hypothetical protein